MRLEYVPLLQLQRDLYRMPRGMERFRQYLRTMVTPDGDDLSLPPLVIINPMAREHVPALLDEYLSLNADEAAAQAVAEAQAALPGDPEGEFKVALVMADDLKGGWTNRYAYEFAMRFGTPARTGSKSWRRRSWLAATLWSSEPASLDRVRETVLLIAHRLAYQHGHGPARTLREMLAQEGDCMLAAGCTGPILDPDDLEYTREVIASHLDATDMRSAIECLFGDVAARSLGFTPRGLSHQAGLALALYDARACSTACRTSGS